MKPETIKLIDRKRALSIEALRIKRELAQINRELSALTYGATEITPEMLEMLPFNEVLTGRDLRELSRSWRRFLSLPLHSQDFELARCNIATARIGTNGRRFIRREF